jgi:hypothetical protein
LENNELVDELSSQTSNELKENAPFFLGCGQYLLQEIRNSDQKKHYITSEDIYNFVNNFFLRKYPDGYYLERHPTDVFCYKMHLPYEAQTELSSFCSRHQEYKKTRLPEDDARFYCYFQQHEQNHKSNNYREIIDIDHPLVKWITSEVDKVTYGKKRCSVMEVDQEKLMPTFVDKGLYVYYVEKWEVKGSDRISELHFFASKQELGSDLLSSEKAESLISVASQEGDSGISYYEDFDQSIANSILDSVKTACKERFDDFSREFRQKRESQRQHRIQFVEQRTAMRIKKLQELIDQFRIEGKTKVIAPTEGKLNKQKIEREKALNALKNDTITVSGKIIGVGLICVI